MSFNDPDNGDIEDEGDDLPENYSVHTRDLPDDIYRAAHESLREDEDWCPYPELVGRVGRALMKAAKAAK